MAAKKYITLSDSAVTGVLSEKAATVVSTGGSNDGDLVALDASGKLDLSVLPTGVGPTTKTIATSEAVAAGSIVNIWDSTGQKVRLADASAASAGKVAMGFVLAAAASGANATVYFEGEITGLSGLTPGTAMYLGTAGALTATPTTTAGQVLQRVGYATSPTTVDFEPGEPIIRA